MAFNDGIPKINCYSLTDFHTFEYCPFRFYVSHHLDKKYELEEGNLNMALGSLLDQAIKKFHQANYYGQPADKLMGLIKASANEIKDKVSRQNKLSFYGALVKFLDEELYEKAGMIFKNYYEKRGGKINKSLGEVKFCECPMEIGGQMYKLWGWPDTYEMGEDGIPEVVDYKYREDKDKGKENIDMDLMPKIYVLLASGFLKDKGYEKARFRVRFWTDPLEEGFYEDFDLNVISGEEFLFKQKIERILGNKEVKFCEKPFCSACNSKERKQFLLELEKLGLIVEDTKV